MRDVQYDSMMTTGVLIPNPEEHGKMPEAAHMNSQSHGIAVAQPSRIN
jgi:hypothetical protein